MDYQTPMERAEGIGGYMDERAYDDAVRAIADAEAAIYQRVLALLAQIRRRDELLLDAVRADAAAVGCMLERSSEPAPALPMPRRRRLGDPLAALDPLGQMSAEDEAAWLADMRAATVAPANPPHSKRGRRRLSDLLCLVDSLFSTLSDDEAARKLVAKARQEGNVQRPGFVAGRSDDRQGVLDAIVTEEHRLLAIGRRTVAEIDAALVGYVLGMRERFLMEKAEADRQWCAQHSR